MLINRQYAVYHAVFFAVYLPAANQSPQTTNEVRLIMSFFLTWILSIRFCI